MNLEKELKKLGYMKWDNQKKPQVDQEIIHRWYKEENEWKLEYYINRK